MKTNFGDYRYSKIRDLEEGIFNYFHIWSKFGQFMTKFDRWKRVKYEWAHFFSKILQILIFILSVNIIEPPKPWTCFILLESQKRLIFGRLLFEI